VPSTDLLHPDNLRSVAGLELAARRTVDTLLPGINRSRRTGAGQEFSQYRSYQPGDDPRRLDWKLYGRSDRFYVREAELETHTTLRFVLDASASMRHADTNGLQKIDYARYLIATLAWLTQAQGDALALYALNDRQAYHLTPRPGRQFFQRLLYELLRIEAGGRFPEGRSLDRLLPQGRHREIVLFLSDYYEHGEEISDALRQLSRTRHEVLLFHLLARNELELDYEGILQFEELETGRTVQVDPRRIRSDYQAQFAQHLDTLRRQLLEWNVHYEGFRLDELPGAQLQRWLQQRA